MANIRQSNFEMLRIIVMFFIVFYHMLLWLSDSYGTNIAQPLWIPLHIAVPIFVLISGYFHIHPTAKGLIKLILPMIIYYIPVEILYNVLTHTEGGSKFYIKTFLFLNYCPYWFIRTYLWLFFIAPLINKFIESIRPSRRFALIALLAFASCCVGIIGDDTSLLGGKNVINFILLYIIGDTIKVYKNIWAKWAQSRLFAFWIVYNAIQMLTFHLTKHGFQFFFEYNSPLLIFNAILFFILFAKIQITNKKINYLASSVFAIYIITNTPVIISRILTPLSQIIYDKTDYLTLYLLALILISLATMLFAISFDKILSPLWNLGNRWGGAIDNRLQHLFSRLDTNC